MHRLILLLLAVAILVYLLYRYRRMTPAQKKKLLGRVLLAIAGVVLVYLVVSGRINWLIAALGAIVPLVPRLFRWLPAVLPFLNRYRQNQHSSMQAKFLRLQINIVTGELQGVVLAGKFEGSRLQDLGMQQFTELLEECREDAESMALLTAYLSRTQPGWEQGHQPSDEPMHYGEMDIVEAREILGVSENASRDEIIQAHRRLMQKLHPDKGGTGYLAQQVNRAKDKLLSSLEGGTPE